MYYNSHQELKTNLSPLTGIGLFFCLFILMFIIVAFASQLLMTKMSNAVVAIRIATLLQDVLAFMLPAIVTAMLMTRLPARFLFVEIAPRLWPLLIAIATLFASMPWMNAVIDWNDSITFPKELSELEKILRETEQSTSDVVNSMLAGASAGSMILSVCIVGLLAGLSEELFFRGALLRLFTLTRINIHVAVWGVAVLFSLMHLQFFGFVPRMLLGAFFGYLVVWSRCLWIPIVVHIVNNSSVVVIQWLEENSNTATAATAVSEQMTHHWALIIASLVLTAGGIWLFRKNCDEA